MTPASDIRDALHELVKARAMEQEVSRVVLGLIASGRVSRVERVDVAAIETVSRLRRGGFRDVVVERPTEPFDVDAACAEMSRAIAAIVEGCAPEGEASEFTLIDGFPWIAEDDGRIALPAQSEDALAARVRFYALVAPDPSAAPPPVIAPPSFTEAPRLPASDREIRTAYVDPVTFRELADVGDVRVEVDRLGEFFTVVSPALRVRVQSTAAIGAASAMKPTETRWVVTNPHDPHVKIEFEHTPHGKLVATFSWHTLEAVAHGAERARLRIRNPAGALVADVNVSKLDTDPNLTVSCMRVGAALLWDVTRGMEWRPA